MGRSYYQLLGVAPHASTVEIRRAYHRLARLHHPDANPGTVPPAGPAMAEINVAWEVLSDPEKRRSYDRAIGTTPRPRTARAAEVEVDEDDFDDLDHLRDSPLDVPARQRPSDLLVAVPVLLFLLVVATFAFATMVQSNFLRTAALLMVPVTLCAFAAAPLFVMLRSRQKETED
jgi:hypothetical protein